MSEIGLGTLYDMNKTLMEKEENKISKKDFLSRLKNVTDFFTKGEYFMLLCHEERDYTVFRLTTSSKGWLATEELKACLTNRGEVLSLDPTGDGAFEIWIKKPTGVFCYYLFPYDSAVIVC